MRVVRGHGTDESSGFRPNGSNLGNQVKSRRLSFARADFIEVLRGSHRDVHVTSSLRCGEQKSRIQRVNYWNIIADTLDGLNKGAIVKFM